LLQGSKTQIRLSDLNGFERINLSDIFFERSDASHITFGNEKIVVQANAATLKRYASLAEQLLTVPVGHQYLDAETRSSDTDLVISTGEYGEDFFRKFRSQL
jgi:hypothetical protein